MSRLAIRKKAPVRKPKTTSQVKVRLDRVWIPATQSSDGHYGTGAELSKQNQVLSKKRAYELANPKRDAV